MIVRRCFAIGALLIGLSTCPIRPGVGDDDLAALRTFSSIGKGSPALDGYREAELLRHEGKGCLTHMWFGGDWPGYEKTRLRIYVDGEQTPSIDMELGLGHGYGFGEASAPWGGERLGKTGHPSGVYNTYRIPFGTSVRVTAQRDEKSPETSPFWWIVRGTENLPVTIGGVRLPRDARLKLHRLENHTAKPMEEFNLCDVRGAGALSQVTIAARGLRETGDWKNLSFLEACMRAYVDGSVAAHAALLGPGGLLPRHLLLQSRPLRQQPRRADAPGRSRPARSPPTGSTIRTRSSSVGAAADVPVRRDRRRIEARQDGRRSARDGVHHLHVGLSVASGNRVSRSRHVEDFRNPPMKQKSQLADTDGIPAALRLRPAVHRLEASTSISPATRRTVG